MTEQLEGQMSIADLGLPYGKTSPEHSAATEEKTSKLSCKPSAKSAEKPFLFLGLRKASGQTPVASWERVTALPGASMTLNTGESPSVGRESTLSQILQANVPEKYYLSPKACAGILRRAEKRGKELPPILKEAPRQMIEEERATTPPSGMSKEDWMM